MRARLSMAGFIAVGALFLGLLIYAATLSVLARSTVRWPAVGGAGAAGAWIVLLWRRHLWRHAAWGAVLIFLATLAAMAWFPDGRAHGLALLGDAAVIIFPALMGVGSVTAAIMLLRWRSPAWRVGVLLLGGYVVGATAVEAARGGFDALLRTRSSWSTLPLWFQGAVLGLLALLPAGIVAGAVDAIRGARRSPAVLKSLSLSLVLLIALPAVYQPPWTAPVGSTRGSGESPPSPPPMPSPTGGAVKMTPIPWPSPEGSAAALQEYRAALDRLKHQVDRSVFDVGALQGRLGRDVKAMLGFVREEIRLEPYAGVLRGARGALLARGGNAADRALLLAELLRRAGYQVRFAEGTLSRNQAEVLVRSALRRPRTGADTPLHQEILRRAAAHFLVLGDALYGAGHRPSTQRTPRWDHAVRAAQDHVWVQVAAGDRWMDLDPASPDGAPLTRARRVGDVPDLRFHRVTLRLEVQVVEGDRTLRHPVLLYEGRAADLVDVPLGIFFDVQGEMATAVLVVGGELLAGPPFRISKSAAAGTGAILPLPGTPKGGGAIDALTGAWLTVVTDTPEGSASATYTIFEQGPSGSTSASAEDALGAVLGIGVITGEMPGMLLAAVLADTDDPLSRPGITRFLALRAFTYGVLRGAVDGTAAEDLPLRYVDAPNVFIAEVRSHGPARDARVQLSFDLTRKAYRTLRAPEDPLAGYGEFYDTLAHGMLDHLVERVTLGADFSDRSVGALFEQAIDQGIPVKALLQPTDPLPAALGGGGIRRLTQGREAGRAVVLPEALPRGWSLADLGWWEVDQRTGWATDVTASGRHQSTVERSVQETDTRKKSALVCVQTLRIAVNVVIPTLTRLGGLPPQFVEFLEETRLDDALEKVAEGLCTRFGPVPRDIPPPPKWTPFPPAPRRMPNPGSNPFKNPPAVRWPPGAPRKR